MTLPGEEGSGELDILRSSGETGAGAEIGARTLLDLWRDPLLTDRERYVVEVLVARVAGRLERMVQAQQISLFDEGPHRR